MKEIFGRLQSERPPDWETEHPPRRVSGMVVMAVGLAAVGGIALATVGMAGRSAPAEGKAAAPPQLPAANYDPAERAQVEAEVRLALGCVNRFFKAQEDVGRLAQLRPAADLVARYQAARGEILGLRKAFRSPGGGLRREPPFIGIPLPLAGQPPRIAWVQIHEGGARLDLDSLLGAGSVPWPELDRCEAGARVTLRGRLQVPTGEGSCGVLSSPDDTHRLRLDSLAWPELSSTCEVRLQLERLPSSPFRQADWQLVKVLGTDWLERP